jgi:hypothetical protein
VRGTAAALAVLALAAGGAAGTPALGAAGGRSIDETYACNGPEQGGVSQARFDLLSTTRVTVVTVFGDHFPILRTSYPKKNQINVDAAACQKVSGSFPLARAALPAAAHLTATPKRNVETTFECWAAKLLVRLRVTFTAAGDPATAIVAVRNTRTGKPIAYARQIPPHLDTFTAPACRHF